MMEIVYGPVIAACGQKSALFAAFVAVVLPAVMSRMSVGPSAWSLTRRAGLGLLAGGLFGLVHLVVVCAADGFPPRIIQSTGIALALTAMLGTLLLWRASTRTAPSR